MNRIPQLELARRLWLAWLSARLGVSYATAARRMADQRTPTIWVGWAATIDAAAAQAIADSLGLDDPAVAARIDDMLPATQLVQ